MKNVLIIASDFPPVGGVSTQRTLKFVKYLHCFGWSPIVLTTENNRYTDIFTLIDASLLSEIPKNVKVYKTPWYDWLISLLLLAYAIEKGLKGSKFWKYIGMRAQYILKYILLQILNRLVFPDLAIGWYPFAIRKGKYIIRRYGIDMLYSTSPSPVAHLIALKLATKYNIPWVADFRDPWAYAYWWEVDLVPPIKRIDIGLEKKVLARANRIVVLEPQIISELKMLKKDFDLTRCSIIYNGYDEEDFKDISSHIFDQFTIVYAGKFRRSGRSPEHLFVTLSSIFQEYPDLKNKIRVVFIGEILSFVVNLVKEYNLEGCVEMLGFLNHKKALSYVLGASVLYLLAVETKQSKKPFQGKNVIPAKLYEYLRARRPILALVPEDSDCARIVRTTQSGVVVEPTDYQKAKKVILDMYEKYEKDQLRLKSNGSLIQQYERKILTGSLAKIFDDLLLERRGNEK